ncbi:hypothetical protein [Candidatus Villigracilis saccharophilus]|uniref:hypothetical protein n=1 Tax=Candidatus Villigracilis saccharophilus TaxID=3140684 RepID=UPI0031366358|nr:hypothetical protein [Anaerolineales bacterium]
MNEILVSIIFGWPFVALSIFVSVIGIVFERAGLVLIGAVLIIPFCYHLSGSSIFSVFSLLLPVFQAGSAWAVKEENETWSWLLLMPTVSVIGWLVVVGLIS